MIKNYLRVAIRNLLRSRTYSFINIAGLAVGLAGFILISIFIKNELSYDAFNVKADRIYRVVEIQDFPGIGKQDVAVTMGPLAPALRNYFSQVQDAVRILPVPSSTCKIGSTGFYEKSISFADPSIFNVFTFPLIEGDPKTALENPYSLVITQSIAGKYFGNADPVGKTIRLDFGLGPHDYAITGVMKDCPQNSHLYFEMLGSFKTLENSIPNLRQWGDNWLATYVLLKKGIDYRSVNSSFPEFIDKNVPKESWKDLWMYLQPLTDIHLHSGDIPYQTFNHNEGSISTIRIFSLIAVFILLIACINFTNLSTARSGKRTKEIGIRKVLGSTRKGLIGQYIGESVMVSVFALFAAMILAELALPYFKNIFGERIIFTYSDSPVFFIELLGIAILVGLAAGSYPAVFLSGFQPAATLKGTATPKDRSVLFRRVLVVLQFSIAVALIACTEIVSKQMNYIQDKNLGFNKEQVLYIPIRSTYAQSKIPVLKEELMRNPDIVNVGAGSGLTGASGNEGTEVVAGTNGTVQLAMTRSFIDFDYIKTMQMQVVEGRDFSADIPSDSSAVIINQAAVRKLGWKNPIGKQFEGTPLKTVIGVVKDFNFNSLHSSIEPLIMEVMPSRFSYLLVRLKTKDARSAVSSIGSTWDKVVQGESFDYSFLDQYFDDIYRNDQRTGQIFLFFSSIAILIACLGIFGLAAYTAEKRTKEIGIRKVIGASTGSIVGLLSGEFILLVLLAAVVATPVSYYFMNKWLETFAYHVSIDVVSFMLAGFAAIFIALVTTGFQAMKAATANPVEALRYE
jgi:putative ABC transport system permease protein